MVEGTSKAQLLRCDCNMRLHVVWPSMEKIRASDVLNIICSTLDNISKSGHCILGVLNKDKSDIIMPFK